VYWKDNKRRCIVYREKCDYCGHLAFASIEEEIEFMATFEIAQK